MGPSIKGGNNGAGEKIEEKKLSLSSDKVAGRRDGIAER
jgi:hypothetical protein